MAGDRLCQGGLLGATLELMAAHEIGHCRRYLAGTWYGLPAGFAAAASTDASVEPSATDAAGQAARREEAYGDLVGLAWIQQRHPEHYARLHAWLVAERSSDVVAGSPHDTPLWVALAGDGSALAGAGAALAPLFAAADRVWAVGLRQPD